MKLRIKDLRLARGWTQEALAERVGLSVPYLSQIERGANRKQPGARLLGLFAEALGCSVGELFASEAEGAVVDALLRDYRSLPPEKQRLVEEFTRALAETRARAIGEQ